MKGTILDFLQLAADEPTLAKELVELASKFDFEFTDEVSDNELDGVSGGGVVKTVMSSLTGGGFPDGMTNPMSTPSSSSGVVPIPYPDTSSPDGGEKTKFTKPGGGVTISSEDSPG